MTSHTSVGTEAEVVDTARRSAAEWIRAQLRWEEVLDDLRDGRTAADLREAA